MNDQKLKELGITKISSGKVRDLHQWKDELWLIASDRISAFDVILPNPIPGKGILLTQLSKFWFESTGSICPNHLISFELPENVEIPEWQGRLTRCRRLDVMPIECIARGYLAGSAWKEYQEKSTVGGILVPPGLQESETLPEVLFTPSTKAQAGHDEALSPQEAIELVGLEKYDHLKQTTIALYQFAHDYARQRGVILADTKFEFAWEEDQPILVDEILTPDSSRYWPAETYSPGRSQASFDKQFVRDYLEGLDWDKSPPGPALPQEIIEKTYAKYQEAWERLTGKKWGQTPHSSKV